MSAVDAYIEAAHPDAQPQLRELAAIVRAVVPEASEKIAYGMPTWHLHTNLVHIGAFATHVSLFPGGIAQEFAADFGERVTGKGTIQFAFGEPIPVAAVEKIVRFRVEQNRAQHQAKLTAKKDASAKTPPSTKDGASA